MGLKLRGTSIEDNRIFYVLIILACMNIYEEGALLTLILGLYFLWKSHFRFETDSGFVCMLVVTGCVIFTSVLYNRAYVECIKAFIFVLLYIVGRRGYTLAEDKEAFIKRTLFAVFFGFFIQLILQYGYNFGKTYERARTMYSIWTQQAIAVTLIGLLSAAIIGYSFYGIFLCKKKIIKALSIAAIILTAVVNLASATRTPVYLMFVSFIVMAIIFFSDSSTTNSRGKIRMLRVLLVLVIGLFVAFEMNAFNLKTYVEASALLGRVSYAGIRTGRTTLFTQYNRLMPEHLWGGGHMRAIIGRSAHNYLQESYDLYGVFSFLALIVFTFHMIGNLVKLLKIKGKKDYHFLMISMGIATFVQCCLEPVMTGYPIVFWVLIMLDGMATSCIKDEKNWVLA